MGFVLVLCPRGLHKKESAMQPEDSDCGSPRTKCRLR